MKAKVNISTESMSIDGNADEDDDEIIYVEPPPVPIINVEDESDSEASEKNSVTESGTQELPSEKQPSQDLDDASNDFNLSLHGSEFHDAEFIKPANSTDHYETETESTTSTSDFHRDSSRDSRPSISTIVFNEVNFPKEDIFDGSNLDKFSELITPNRVNIAAGDKGDENGDQESFRSHKKVKPRTSSESSSESDYDSVETHKNLPVLTPMVCADSSLSTSNKSKTKSGENDKKNKEPSSSGKRSRKSKRGNFSDDNDGILDVEQSEKVMESRKNKRRSSGSPLDDDVPKKKAKNKKKKSGNTSADQDALIKDSATPERNFMRGSGRDGTQSSWIVTSTPRFSMPIIQVGFNHESSDSENDDDVITSDVPDDTLELANISTGANKDVTDEGAHKANENTSYSDTDVTSNQQNEIYDVTFEEVHENGTPGDIEENSKKKTKKRKQNMLPDNRIPTEDANNTADQEGILEVTSEVSNLEGHEGVASEDNVDNQRKDKRKKRNSSEKRMSVEYKTGTVEKNKDFQETKDGKDILDILKEGDSVIIIDQAVSVHTIESSDSENDDDVITSDVPDDTLELANISTGANKDVTDEGAHKANENKSYSDTDVTSNEQNEIYDVTFEEVHENSTPGDIEENSKKKTKKRKQKMLPDNRIPTEDTNNTADQEGILEVTSEVSNLEGHEGVASEDNVDNQMKDKRKKRNSSEKRMSVEDKTGTVEKNKDHQETKDGKDILDILEEDILKEGDSVIIIEQAVSVHTIESSDSENDDDVITSDVPDDTLELANISTSANKDVTDEGAHKANENTSDFDFQSRLSKMFMIKQPNQQQNDDNQSHHSHSSHNTDNSQHKQQVQNVDRLQEQPRQPHQENNLHQQQHQYQREQQIQREPIYQRHGYIHRHAEQVQVIPENAVAPPVKYRQNADLRRNDRDFARQRLAHRHTYYQTEDKDNTYDRHPQHQNREPQYGEFGRPGSRSGITESAKYRQNADPRRNDRDFARQRLAHRHTYYQTEDRDNTYDRHPQHQNREPQYGEFGRPGSRSGITESAAVPFTHYVNYKELQTHISRKDSLSGSQIVQMRLQVQQQRLKVDEESRKQHQYHSQRQPRPDSQLRPISNYYQYESVQSVLNNRQFHQNNPPPPQHSNNSNQQPSHSIYAQHDANSNPLQTRQNLVVRQGPQQVGPRSNAMARQ